MAKEKDTILINIMYTGDYTNKNIGHEIINMYKTTTTEDSYLYISPYGYVTSGWDNRIKKILYARSAGKDKLEIIAKAEIKSDEQIIKGMVERPKLKLSGNDEGLKEIKNEWKTIVMQHDDEYNQFINDLKCGEVQARKEIKKNNKIDILTLIDKYFPEYKKELKDTYKHNDNYKEWIKNYDNIKNYIDQWETSYDEWKHNSQESKGYFAWLKYNNEKHLQQIKDIYSNEIKYNKKYLCDIFNGNLGDEGAIYFGYKVTDIKKPTKPIYIEYKEYKKEDKEKAKGENTNNKIRATYDSKIDNTYYFKYAKIKNQSCSFYLNRERIDNFDRFEKDFDKEVFSKEFNTLENSPYHNKYEDYDKALITIMGKQNDELAYSNMFAYYLNNKNIFEGFAKQVLEFNEKIDLSTFEIRREYKNIDLLIITENDIFVIENKIKSGINGEKYDPYNGEYSNQLIKYYTNILNDESIIKDGRNAHFYIFKPNYNEINIEKLKNVKIKEELQEGNIIEEQKDIIDKWCKGIKNYSEIYNFFEKPDNENVKKEFESKNLIQQFKLALKLHKEKNENIIEQEMEYKFRQAIEKVKKNNQGDN